MLVDDDEDVRTLCRAILEREGYAVDEAGDGSELLARLAAGERPDAIILDVMMPETTGWKSLGTMRRDPDLARVPVIMLTADRDDTFRTGGLAGGLVAYLTKPFKPWDLVQAVRTALQPDPWGETPR